MFDSSAPLGITKADIGLDSVLGAWSEYRDVVLWYRDPNGERRKKRIRNCPWYFLVSESDYHKIEQNQWRTWKEGGLIREGRVSNGYVYLYSEKCGYFDRDELRAWLTQLDDLGVLPLEGDLRRENRLLIDTGIGITDNYRIAYWDIETDDRKQDIRIGRDRILSVAIVDDRGKEHFILLEDETDEAEARLIQQTQDILSDYDIVVGWNSSKFDYPYFRSRARELGIKTYAPWLRHQDLLALFKSWFVFEKLQIRRWNLDFVAESFGFEGKVKLPHDPVMGRTYQAWATDHYALWEYNRQDTVLVKQLAEKMETLNFLIQQCVISGLPVMSYSTGNVVDFLLMREAAKRRMAGQTDVRFPTSYYRPEHIAGTVNIRRGEITPSEARRMKLRWLDEHGFDIKKIKGPLVIDPKKGLLEDVYVIDFSSMYPSTMIAFNIGLETQYQNQNGNVPVCISPNGTPFRIDQPSVLSTVLNFMIEQRARYREIQDSSPDPNERKSAEAKQLTLKAITNSCYGVMAQFGRRHYNREVAESITQGSQLYINFGIEWFKNHGCEVVFGDTDSFGIVQTNGVPLDINELTRKFERALREYLRVDFNCPHPEALKMQIEKHYKRVVFLTKKVYAGRMVMRDGRSTDEIFYRGVRLLKRDTPPWAANLERELLERLLMVPQLPNPEKIKEWLLDVKKDFFKNGTRGEDLVVYKIVSKPPESYRTRNLHAELAKDLMKRGYNFAVGSQIGYVITDAFPGPAKGISLVDVTQDTKVDGYWYWYSFWSQAVEFLRAVYPGSKWKRLELTRPTKRNKISYHILPDWSNLDEIDLTKG